MKALFAVGAVVVPLLLAPVGHAQDQDLVLITVNPCVIFDTRPTQGGTGAFTAGEVRNFHIVGATANFAAQGGTAGGCGVPAWSGGQPVAKAIFINYVAIDPQGGGTLKAWAGNKTEPAQGALVNYQALTPPMNKSNGVVTELRQDSEGSDIKVRALSAGVHVRGVILGYFTQEHVTGVVAGTGLAGGGSEGTATLGIADGGVESEHLSAAGSSAGQVLTSTGSAVEWQPPTPGPTGATGPTGDTGPTGPEGSVGRGPVRPVYTMTTLDFAGAVGDFTSIALGTDGLPVIAYRDISNVDVKVARCRNVECTAATFASINSVSPTFNVSLAIGSDGFPIISYGGAGQLHVIHCQDADCTASTDTPVDVTGNTGYLSSIAIGTDGLAVISYQDQAGFDLKAAHCDNLACTSAVTTVLDAPTSTGAYTSIAIGKDGLPVISYKDNDTTSLRLAHCNVADCSTGATLVTVAGPNVNFYNSIAIGSDGLPLISYWDQAGDDLKIVHCGVPDCSSGNTISTVHGGVSSAGFHSSITIGADGLGLISYHDFSGGNLRVAHCSNVLCTSSTHTLLDSPGNVGEFSSITIGSDGFGIISYTNRIPGNEDLKVIHLSNVFGLPFHRRR